MWRFMWRGGTSFTEKFDEVSPALSVEELCVVMVNSFKFELCVYFIAKSCYFCERNLPSFASNNAVIVEP